MCRKMHQVINNNKNDRNTTINLLLQTFLETSFCFELKVIDNLILVVGKQHPSD